MNGTIVELLFDCVIFAAILFFGYAVSGVRRTARHRVVQRARRAAAHLHPDINKPSEALADVASRHPIRALAQRFAEFGERVTILDSRSRQKLIVAVKRAGYFDSRAASILIGLKMIGGALAAFALFIAGPHVPLLGEYFAARSLMTAVAGIVGIILPETVVNYLGTRRQQQIAAYLPDALDLLVICTNAGNSLQTSLKRVASEMRHICVPLGQELSIASDEMQLGGDVALALHGLAERSGVASVRSLVTTLVQAQQYGTPVTEALRTLSRSERTLQILTLEEKAAKLAPKMTLPMMMFVLPTVILIAGGPAAIRLMTLFSKS